MGPDTEAQRTHLNVLLFTADVASFRLRVKTKYPMTAQQVIISSRAFGLHCNISLMQTQ
jgi:hypothetical protein